MVSAQLEQAVRNRYHASVPAPTRQAIRHVVSLARRPRAFANALGARSALRYVGYPVRHELGRLGRREGTAPPHYPLQPRRAAHPIWCRAGSSDAGSVRQIFVEEEYRCVDDLRDPLTLIDCGANVGCASAWFLSRYPSLRVVAVEPEPQNAHMLRRNLRPYGSRATVIEAAVWSRAARLRLVPGEEGREWATHVVECGPDEPHDLLAVDIPRLIDLAGGGPVDVLKIDIEGAERELFAAGTPQWLSAVHNLVIEVHGPELELLMSEAIPPDEFARSRSGELTCFRRTRAGTRLAV
jgi:FkbM family methyltransferase